MKRNKFEKMKKRADILMLKKGQVQEALNIFDEILSQDEFYLPALKGKGCALGYLGRDEEAEAVFDKLLEDNPKDIYALGGKASVLHEKGRSKEALEYCDKALSVLPGDFATLQVKDNILEDLGLPKEMFATNCSKEYIISDLNDRIQLLTKEDFLSSEEGRGGQFYSIEKFMEKFGEKETG